MPYCIFWEVNNKGRLRDLRFWCLHIQEGSTDQTFGVYIYKKAQQTKLLVFTYTRRLNRPNFWCLHMQEGSTDQTFGV